jgi:competence ComEA-like helix-hairpin-helix protein
LVDINSASAEELDRLPGVGPTRAKAIIAHRPYHGKDDLTNRKIIPQNVYNEIKDKIIARQN